ncbi:MAG: homoserine kinase [Dehalococcoidia bacterium]|nr:homoserine kinase [Dehalococcoidia bacterium]
MSQRSVTVQVPATSANLGPGFDSLGVALDWNARITLTVADEVLPAPSGPVERMAASAALTLYQHAGMQVPAGISATYEGDIPVGRGLGVSASARAAGVLAAEALIEGGRSPKELLPLVCRLEGHGDNATPAMLGGFQVVVEDDDEFVHGRFEAPDGLRLALLVPDFSMPTNESRQRLPDRLTRNQAVHNIGRAALLVLALNTRRYDLLGVATEDVLHQPARAALFPSMYSIFQAARDSGAHGVYLSGGGSTVAAFVSDRGDEVAGAMREAAAAHGLDADARICGFSATGAQVIGTPEHA